MKNRMILIAVIACTVVGGGAFLTGSALAQTTPPAAPAAHFERHPEIRKAMRQLNNALNTMQKAADDFKGHKVAAMQDTQNAITELKKALAADRH